MLAQKVDVPSLFQPIFTRLIGILIAAVVAWLAVKSERLVVMALTAVIGGFAIVSFFVGMIPELPFDASFILGVPVIVWTVIKIGLSFAGFKTQSTKK